MWSAGFEFSALAGFFLWDALGIETCEAKLSKPLSRLQAGAG
jgi:hypothetical protein